MIEQHQIPTTEDEINLLDLLLILARRWRMIVGITVLAAVIAAGASLSLPNSYQATAKVIAMQRQMIQPIGALFVSGIPLVGAQKPSLQMVNLPVLQDILQGSSFQQTLVAQLGLVRTISVKTAKSGAIEITAEDPDPKRAAIIANAAVRELGRAAYALNLVASPEITAERDLEKSGSEITTVIKLLEPATIPLHKAKPKRALIVILTTISAVFASTLLAFILEGIKKLQTEDRTRWEAIKQVLRGRSS